MVKERLRNNNHKEN